MPDLNPEFVRKVTGKGSKWVCLTRSPQTIGRIVKSEWRSRNPAVLESLDVRWGDGSLTTFTALNLAKDQLRLIGYPDRGDATAVEQWLSSDGVGAL